MIISDDADRLFRVDNPYANNTFHLSKSPLNLFSVVQKCFDKCHDVIIYNIEAIQNIWWHQSTPYG